MMKGWSTGVQALQQQWATSAVLRVGCWGVVGVLWLNLLFWHDDVAKQEGDAVAALEEEVRALRSTQAGPAWDGRAKEAQSQLVALESMMWVDTSPGLAQATFQDWLTQSSAKAGLTVRELRLSSDGAANLTSGTRTGTSSRTTMTTDSVPPNTSNPSAGGMSEVRARLVVEFKPQALAMLLNEMTLNPQHIMVDRFQLRTWVQPQQAELDVRIQVRKAAAPS